MPQLPSSRLGRDRGQVLPFVALAVVVAAGALMMLARLGVEVADRARARTAADAAALAGVEGGRPAAEQLARDDDGRLERYTDVAGVVEVEVQVGGATATARAAPGDGRTVITASPTRPRRVARKGAETLPSTGSARGYSSVG